jgi:1-acyl-sn-glycerol-3-phosphate acyltransferase
MTNDLSGIYYMAQAISRFIFNVFYDLKVDGLDNLPKPPFIIACNHESNFDPPMVGCHLPYHCYYLAKKQLFENPVLGNLFDQLNAIPVDQENPDRVALRKFIHLLKDDKQVAVVFPEGARTADGQLQEAMPGIGFLVAKAGVPVVPARVFGPYKAWPIKGNISLFEPCRLVIGKPIQFETKAEGKEGYEQISKDIMAEIAKIRDPRL